MRPIDTIYIHHSASPKDTTTVEDIARWHKDAGYDGIGYHRIILGNGEAKMGRPDEKVGAHTYGKNTGSLGICVTGNFDKETPDPEQVAALVQVLAVLCKRHNIKPSRILGHRDALATSCPGKNLYRLLPEIRQKVAAYLK